MAKYRTDKNTKCSFKNKKQGVCVRKADLNMKQIKKLQKKTGLPICDGSSYPFIKGCYSDMSNWSGGGGPRKQCIIVNPATTNLSSGSIYTCGFQW